MPEVLKLTDQRALAYQEACRERGPIAFVAVGPLEKVDGINGPLGIAVANERGYHSVHLGWARYVSQDAAQDHAEYLNRHVLKLTADMEVRIIASTMGGLRFGGAQ